MFALARSETKIFARGLAEYRRLKIAFTIENDATF